MLSIPALKYPDKVRWSIPPSKSHMIRWIALSSQSKSRTELSFQGVPGKDIESMAECMEKMGSSISKEWGRWFIQGNKDGFEFPNDSLDCGNSATAAKIVTSIAACLERPINIDGDSSLRRRDFSALTSALRSLGCEISSDNLPYTVSGPIFPGRTVIDESFSSQTLSGLILASPGFSGEVEVRLRGEAVSRWYRDLTIETSRFSGWSGEYGESMILKPWTVETPEKVEIPGEVSLLPLSMLFDKLHGTESMSKLQLEELFIPDEIKEANNTISGLVDLRDVSDIITPIAAIMALGDGGEIVGAFHSRGKESNRIMSTIRMLSAFGIEAEETPTGLTIPGEQSPNCPKKPLDCEMDHRLAMTAAVLATKVSGELSGHEICNVTHPDFFEMILSPDEWQ